MMREKMMKPLKLTNRKIMKMERMERMRAMHPRSHQNPNLNQIQIQVQYPYQARQIFTPFPQISPLKNKGNPLIYPPFSPLSTPLFPPSLKIGREIVSHHMGSERIRDRKGVKIFGLLGGQVENFHRLSFSVSLT